MAPYCCVHQISIPDTYRRTGGKQRFTMHYTTRHCKRLAVPGYMVCWQHLMRLYHDNPKTSQMSIL
jgi:hypothetical protein